jgi:hypothetical protein
MNHREQQSKFDGGAQLRSLHNLETDQPFRIEMTSPLATGEQAIKIGDQDTRGYHALLAFSKLYALEEYVIVEQGLHARAVDGVYAASCGAVHSGTYTGDLVNFTKGQRKANCWYSIGYLNGRYSATKKAAERQADVHDFVELFRQGYGVITGNMWPSDGKRAAEVLKGLGLPSLVERREFAAAKRAAWYARRDASRKIRADLKANEGGTSTGKSVKFTDTSGEEVKINPRTVEPCLLVIRHQMGQLVQRMPLPTEQASALSALKAYSENPQLRVEVEDLVQV